MDFIHNFKLNIMALVIPIFDFEIWFEQAVQLLLPHTSLLIMFEIVIIIMAILVIVIVIAKLNSTNVDTLDYLLELFEMQWSHFTMTDTTIDITLPKVHIKLCKFADLSVDSHNQNFEILNTKNN
jgi:hypothetical protein